MHWNIRYPTEKLQKEDNKQTFCIFHTVAWYPDEDNFQPPS